MILLFFLPSPVRRVRLNAESYRIFAPGIKTALNADASALPEVIQLAPYGSWPTFEKDENGVPEAVQVFDADVARELVNRFNALHRRLFRLARVNSCKVYVGHPDFAPEVWPERIEVADVTELSFDEAGLNGRMRWNADALPLVRKNKFPSVAWDTQVTSPGQERPIMLWSVGMWHRPNIKEVRSVINALPETNPENPDPTNEPNMNLLEQIKALLIKSGLLKETDTDEAVLSGISSMISSVAWQRTQEKENEDMCAVIKTALNAEGDQPLGALVTRLVTDHAGLISANTERETRLNAEVTAATELRERIRELDLFPNIRIEDRDTERVARNNACVEHLIETGRITKAEEEATRTRLNADPDKALAELLQSPSKHGGRPLNVGCTRPVIAEAQERITRINAWTEQHMAEKRVSYDEAYKAAQAAPELKPLFDAQKAAAAQ